MEDLVLFQFVQDGAVLTFRPSPNVPIKVVKLTGCDASWLGWAAFPLPAPEPGLPPHLAFLEGGSRLSEGGETCTSYVVFDRAWVETERRDDESLEEAAERLSGFYARYGGPGRWFRSAPWARVSRTRILVKQYGGLDV